MTFPLCKQKVFLINITSFVYYVPIHFHHLFSKISIQWSRIGQISQQVFYQAFESQRGLNINQSIPSISRIVHAKNSTVRITVHTNSRTSYWHLHVARAVLGKSFFTDFHYSECWCYFFSMKHCSIDQCPTWENTFCKSCKVITFWTGLYLAQGVAKCHFSSVDVLPRSKFWKTSPICSALEHIRKQFFENLSTICPSLGNMSDVGKMKFILCNKDRWY